MKSKSRIQSPAPRAGTSATAEQAKKKDTVRTPRPYEFGGNFGCAFWTFFIPLCVYYAYGTNVLKHGVLVVPDQAFWNELIWGLPDGIAVRPTAQGFYILTGWLLLQFSLQQFMPGPMRHGIVLKNGRQLPYKLNGWRSYCATWLLLGAGLYSGHIEPTLLYKNFGSMMTWANIYAYGIALYLYVHFGLLWRRWVSSPEYEADWGVFKISDFFHDYWMGTARNPRIFHFLGYPLDLKFFFEARPGLLLWVLINWSNLAAMYQGCHLTKGALYCSARGDWSRVPYAMWFVAFSQCYYIFDYYLHEKAILSTTDIVHETFGFMLMWGDLGFLPWMYTNSFSMYLVSVKPRYKGNLKLEMFCFALWFVAMALFRLTNIQKNNFRAYAAEHGNNPTGFKIWGKQATYIRTKKGSFLLTSGFWGMCRHPNYMPDMLMAVAWCLSCTAHSTMPIVPFGYVMYFWSMDIHRFFRDEHRCKEKYTDDWDKYVQAVPYRLIPHVW